MPIDITILWFFVPLFVIFVTINFFRLLKISAENYKYGDGEDVLYEQTSYSMTYKHFFLFGLNSPVRIVFTNKRVLFFTIVNIRNMPVMQLYYSKTGISWFALGQYERKYYVRQICEQGKILKIVCNQFTIYWIPIDDLSKLSLLTEFYRSKGLLKES